MSIIPILDTLKHRFGKNSINVIEIGARYGESSKTIIQNLVINEYIIIDPYTTYEEYNNDGFNNIISRDKEDEIYHNTKNGLRKIHSNIRFYRTFSNDQNTINSIENNSIDLVFIDGNHSYKYVLEDLENYYPKLKENGIICGDDFFMRSRLNDTLNTMPGSDGYDEPMVYEAVVEFCEKYGKTYTEFGIHRGYGKTFMIN